MAYKDIEKRRKNAREYMRQWRRENPEKAKAANKRAHERHRDDRLARNKRWRKKNRGHKQGLKPGQWDALWTAQGGKCGICLVKFQSKHGVHTDHDYVTGKVRGLLHGGCNMGLGSLGDDIRGLKLALDYLRRAECGTLLP